MTTYASEIASTMLNQLGGRRFMVFTGSKVMSVQENGSNVSLTLGLTRNATSANRMVITYNAGKDLYEVDFNRDTFSRKTFESKSKNLKHYEDVYCDMLVNIFERTTGLVTRF